MLLRLILGGLIIILLCNCSTIVHLPLDERFTTRVAFLNLATLTPFKVVSLPQSLLPSLKQSKSANDIGTWFCEAADGGQMAVISLQMFLYGSLIASRISNETESVIKARIDKLQSLKKANPKLKIYASAVVMRIPAYDNDFQQPAYWASYGRLLYLYSFFADKYSKTGDVSDLSKSLSYKNQVPSSVVNEFLNRRFRNQNILIELINRYSLSFRQGNPLFERLYITLDDNAQYGFNIAEADHLKKMVVELNLTARIMIYPGADEVPLVLLSKAVTDYFSIAPSMRVIYRNDSTKDLIPNYEGDPLSQSVANQIKAAGAEISATGDIFLLVNNFNGPFQKQAPNQGGDESTDYSKFLDYLAQAEHKVIGLVDNKYSNGADIAFVNFVLEATRQVLKNITQWCYAGWNTNGNTLGTVIANSVLLHVVSTKRTSMVVNQQLTQKYCQFCSPCLIGDYKCGNSYFNLLRLIQDRDWQAILRQKMISYIQDVPGDDFNHLDIDSQFYQKFALKSFSSKAEVMSKAFNLDFKMTGVYFPWNRTFQIGMVGQISGSVKKGFPSVNQRYLDVE